MKTLQTGAKVLIEATVEATKDNDVMAVTKSAYLIRVDKSDLTVCETAEPIDLSNFCIDITDPVNAELLEGFKEWLIKNGHENIQDYFGGWKFFGKRQNHSVAEGFQHRALPPLTTLPDLQKQHPGVFGETKLVDLTCMGCGKSFKGEEPKMRCSGRECGCMGQPIDPVICSEECYYKLSHMKSKEKANPQQIEVGDTVVANGDHFMKNGDGKQTLTDKKHYEVISVNEGSFAIIDDRGAHHTFPVDLERAIFFYKIIKKSTPTPSFKAGQEVEIGVHGVYKRCKYVGRYSHGYVGESLDENSNDPIIYGIAIRPIPAQPTVLPKEVELEVSRILAELTDGDNEYGVYHAMQDFSKLWHQKHSGRVEVSDKEILQQFDKIHEGVPHDRAVIATVRHFMTRKEAK